MFNDTQITLHDTWLKIKEKDEGAHWCVCRGDACMAIRVMRVIQVKPHHILGWFATEKIQGKEMIGLI